MSRFSALVLISVLTLGLSACATSPMSGESIKPTPESTQAAQTKPPVVNIDQQQVKALEGPAKDLWERIRRGFAMKDLQGPLVDDRTQWYASRPDYVERMTGRSSRYMFHIVEELERRKMPTELALLPFIESAFNPQANSTAKASGMWQFIPSTGRAFNLKQNMFRDERRDVLASTGAALDYLQKLYNMFGDWHLALAAYNWGEGSVGRAIAKNQRAGLPTDYASLNMPNETRYYVPKLQAVKNIIANPAAYNLKLPDVANHPYFVTVTTARDVDVELVAKLAELPLAEFKALNPSFNRPVILGATNPQILLPFDNAEKFQANLTQYKKPLSSWTAVTVGNRERVETLAGRLGVDAGMIRDVNKIPKGMRLKAGSTVLVPKAAHVEKDISQNVADNGQMAIEPDLPDTKKVVVRARKKDTAAKLAARYGVTAGQVKAWNGLRGDALKPGQAITLTLPYKKAMALAGKGGKAVRGKAGKGGGRHAAGKATRGAGGAKKAGKRRR